MKQKYLIVPEKTKLTIKEYSEMDKGVFVQVGEVEYGSPVIKAAREKETATLINEIRTPNFYPVSTCAAKLAESIVDIYKLPKSDPVEVFFNNVECIVPDEKAILDADNEASVAIDELLDSEDDGGLDSDLPEDSGIKDISSSTSIKLADEDDLVEEDDK